MTKAEFVTGVAEKMQVSNKEAEKAVNAVVEQLTDLFAQGDKLALPGFGTFSVTSKNAKRGINPKTGEVIEIPARIVPKFKVSSKLITKA